MPESNLEKLSGLGQSVWIDSLSREMLESGRLAALMRDDAVTGVTSNPTIFQKALAEGSRYDAQLGELLASSDDPTEIFFALASRDVSNACELMSDVWDGGAGLRGYVSIEVDPTLAYDTERTFDQARRLHAGIDRPNLYVKIPATRPGLPAIEDMIAAGKSINVTLIFSLQRHREVMEAYVRGLERLVAGGGDPRKVASVASFFVSRVDTEADRRLETVGSPTALALRGRLAVANARLAYRNWQQVFSGERWQFLASKGASKQWCLWASTSTKNPDYPDTLYVDSLIGPETVNTMPLETVEAFQDHGTVALTLEEGVDEARSLLRELAGLGVDVDDVTETLEEEGVQKFADSFQQLLDGIRAKRGELVSA
jgi:transaldolase